MGYFVFIFLMFIFLIVSGEVIASKGFYNLNVKRKVNKKEIYEGEEFTITLIIENNKLLPISFLVVKEEMPSLVEFCDYKNVFTNGNSNYSLSPLSISWRERIKRTYKLKATKRGTFLVKNITITIGDYFGFASETRTFEDFIEIVVYPKTKKISQFIFNTNSMQGENVIKRWLYKDTLFIKGIREYNAEDRMKDIHWKSTLKMEKLMVKDYDYTSEREAIIILNVQCGEPYWSNVNYKVIDQSIDLSLSIASTALKEGIPVGMWTNARIISYSKDKFDVNPSINSMRSIRELCARADYSPKIEFDDYLAKVSNRFNKNCTYIIITSYLNLNCVNVLLRLKRAGILIKIVDTSLRGDISKIKGIEKIDLIGEVG